MTPQEKDLIQSVFDRLARAGVGQKDAEAEALIRDNLQRLPDGPYGLVQAVIVQEMALNQASARIAELQHQLDAARAGGQAPAGGGSFLGGAGPWGGASVPRSGPVAPPSPPPMQAPAAPAAPWGYAPAAAPAPAASPWGGGTGGFLRNAATMAAGVAGGTLIAEGLSNLFGGHHMGGGFGGGLAGAGPWGSGAGPAVENVTVNNYYGDQGGDASDQDYASNDGAQDASWDDASASYDDGGFDDSVDV